MTRMGMAAIPIFSLSQEPPEHIYHYTRADGLKGIIQRKALWASAAYYLNDTSEVEYGCQMAADAIDETLANTKCRLVSSALRHVSGTLRGESEAQTRAQTIFVSCFCEQDNLLSQWRAYGRAGGYSISFKSVRTLDLRPKFGSLSTALVKVLYDRDDQKGRVKNLIDKAVELLTDPAITSGTLNGPWTNDIERPIGEFLSQMFMSVITSFKSPAFSEELEWRLIARPFSLSFSTLRQDTLAEIRRIVEFRTAQQGLVPYIELGPSANVQMAGIIDGVRFGPSANPRLVQSATRLLLDSENFQSANVVGSDIPVLL
jgi:hypothetical protein